MLYLTFFAIILILGLITQQALILYRSTDLKSEGTDEHWYRTSQRYKVHIRATISCGVLLYVAVNVLVLANEQAASAYRSIWSDLPEPAFVLVLAFITGAIRMILDRASDEPRGVIEFTKQLFSSFFLPDTRLRKTAVADISSATLKADPKMWFYWFIAMVLIAPITFTLREFTPNLDQTPNKSHLLNCAIALSANTAMLAAWYAWIYVGLFDKMTRIHEFSGRAARRFLGAIFRSHTPLQAVVIGPKKSGKTAFCLAKEIKGDLLDTKCVQEIPVLKFSEIQTTNEDVVRNREYSVNLIDTPGENMGDHLLLITHFRCDSLVIIFRVKDMIQGNMEESFFEFENFSKLFEKESVAFYAKALYSAVRRTSDLNDATRVYKVRSVVLFFNVDSHDDRLYAENIFKNMPIQKLAQSIGESFGVAPSSSTALFGAAIQDGQARNQLIHPSHERKVSNSLEIDSENEDTT